MGGAGNVQVKRLKNNIETFKVLSKEFLESRGCGRRLGSDTGHMHTLSLYLLGLVGPQQWHVRAIESMRERERERACNPQMHQ